MTGDHGETLRDTAMSQRDSSQPGGSDGGAQAGDDLDRNPGLRAGDDLFPAAPEDERIPTFEPDHDKTLARCPDQDGVDLPWGVKRPRGIFETSMIWTPSPSPSRTASGASRSTTTTSASANA